MLASACFSPDAPPFQGATLGTDPTIGDTVDTSDTLVETTTDTGVDSTTVAATSASSDSDPTTDTGVDGSSSEGTPEACGDGSITGPEACDDGNAEAGDGCSDACELEPGFACDGQPSTCTATCGDGIVVADEQCDDDNASDGDGCTACTTDEGYDCTGMPSVCVSPCGDGMVAAGEACDDDNVSDGDGCAADCSVELHYRCMGAGPGSCMPIHIGYVPADGDDAAFRGAIAAITGGPVDYLDASSNTPTVMALQAGYDCVFTHPNNSYLDAITFGDRLAAFVDGGGNVVLGIATDFAPPTGLSGSMIMTDAYSPIGTSGGVTYGPTASYAGDGVTPIHDGVVGYDAPIFDAGVVLQGGGIQDGSYDNGTIAAAYRPDFKVVYVNGTGNSSFGPMGDWPRLVANACAVGFL